MSLESVYQDEIICICIRYEGKFRGKAAAIYAVVVSSHTGKVVTGGAGEDGKFGVITRIVTG